MSFEKKKNSFSSKVLKCEKYEQLFSDILKDIFKALFFCSYNLDFYGYKNTLIDPICFRLEII